MDFCDRPWTRRQTLSFLVGAVGGITLHACKAPNSAPTSTSSGAPSGTLKATLGVVTWVGYTPLWIAQEKGFFKELGLDLTIKVFGTNPDGLAAFRAGKIDAWASVIPESVLLAANGKEHRVVLVADQSVGADGILARNSIASIKDFKGKTIAVEEGAVSHFFLLQVLKEAGLTRQDVKLINTAPDAAAAAYQAGKVEIAVTYSPFMEKAAAAQKDGRIIYDSSKMPGAITDQYIFDAQFVAANPAAIAAYVKGVFKGLKFLQTNPQEGYAIAAKKVGVSPAELEDSLKHVKLVDAATNLEMLGNPQSPLYQMKSIQAFAEFLKEQKQIQQIPDFSKALDPQFVKTASAS
jgi:NitT/TauT family transport system substrate-binding protein